MKKHDEGYTLPFVLVVFLVISLVATSLLTISLRNLQSQKASIQRMEAQYIAQGEIEKVVAKVLNVPKGNAFNEGMLETFCGTAVQADGWQYDDTDKDISFTLKAAKGTVEISCKVVLSGIEQQVVAEDTYQYLMQDPKVTYESYTIATIEPDGGVE